EFRGGAAQQSLLILTSNSGKSLTPLERGKVFSRLLNYGWSISDIASKTGVSEVTVRQLAEMCTLPAFLQDQIQQNRISSSLAVHMFENFGAEKSIEIISAIAQYHAEQGINKKITKKMVQSFLDMDLNGKEKKTSYPPKKPSKKVALKMQSALLEISGLFENVKIEEDEQVFISVPGNLAMQIIAMSEEIKAA
ncbi:MAG: hypothetical protein RBR08_16510, partial [Desulforegulaceae bacterium]|nr:hypothetical protein [Desulforegulaceae bacterium]